jgi:hypothetical protein
MVVSETEETKLDLLLFPIQGKDTRKLITDSLAHTDFSGDKIVVYISPLLLE